MPSTRAMPDLLGDHPFLTGLEAEALTTLAGCARNLSLDTDQSLFTQDDPADHFYLVRRGRIALELHEPGRGSQILDTVEAGEVVGWSWIVPPYRWFCDARAVEPTGLTALDGRCLRGKCEADPVLGYELLRRVTEVMAHRLQAARVRLLDLYGKPR